MFFNFNNLHYNYIFNTNSIISNNGDGTKLLLDAKANPDIQDYEGWTSDVWAVVMQNHRAKKLLSMSRSKVAS